MSELGSIITPTDIYMTDVTSRIPLMTSTNLVPSIPIGTPSLSHINHDLIVMVDGTYQITGTVTVYMTPTTHRLKLGIGIFINGEGTLSEQTTALSNRLVLMDTITAHVAAGSRVTIRVAATYPVQPVQPVTIGMATLRLSHPTHQDFPYVGKLVGYETSPTEAIIVLDPSIPVLPYSATYTVSVEVTYHPHIFDTVTYIVVVNLGKGDEMIGEKTIVRNESIPSSTFDATLPGQAGTTPIIKMLPTGPIGALLLAIAGIKVELGIRLD